MERNGREKSLAAVDGAAIRMRATALAALAVDR